MTGIVVHPRTRSGYAAERLRKAEVITDQTERLRFLEDALLKYRYWSLGLGVPPSKVSADVAILRNEFFPPPQTRLRA
jgi:hypothetical protein